jgi:hemolysin III
MRDPREEKWNSITHAIGVGIFFPTLFSASPTTRFLSLVLLSTYILSVLYHASEAESVRSTMRMLDIASIHASIYGTSVVYAALLGAPYAVCFSLVILGMASIRYVVVKYDSWYFERCLVPTCMLSGSICLVTILCLPIEGSQDILSYFLAGLLAYVFGLIFYVNDERRWYHTIWHVFVLLGSLIHVIGTT